MPNPRKEAGKVRKMKELEAQGLLKVDASTRPDGKVEVEVEELKPTGKLDADGEMVMKKVKKKVQKDITCPKTIWSRLSLSAKRMVMLAARENKRFDEVLLCRGIPKTALYRVNGRLFQGKCWLTPQEADDAQSIISRRHHHDRRFEKGLNTTNEIVAVMDI